ncbi:hypothetical protein [Kiloniella majae]|uniref:hypothetical protein n=1 Tax=Kiloniella majae TaxID=1938558 RepID=UPI000A279116|nr:hypothetical protein [Kiloniella majae]
MSHPKVLSTLDKLVRPEKGDNLKAIKSAMRPFALIGCLAISFILGLSVHKYFFLKTLQTSDLERLTVVVAENTGQIATRVWDEAEKNAGKKIKDLTPSEKVDAAAFLLRKIKKEPKTDSLPVW